MTLNFTVIGIDQVTNDPTIRFRCSTNDGESIYVGSDNPNASGHVWQYKNNAWARITDDLGYTGFRGVQSILHKNNTLYVGTNGGYAANDTGKVWSTSGNGWTNTGLSNAFSTSIRKLLSINQDIYAAGSLAYVWKLTNSTWSDAGFLSYPNVASWLDLATDGTNLYGVSLNDTGTQISGVIRYNGSTWQQISNPKFGDSDNYFTSKLCWANGKLYAATFNVITGSQIWEYNGTSWTKISNSQLWSRNNYNVIDIKPIDGNLVVSIENVQGGQIWSYDFAGNWEQHSLVSDVNYTSYLIESVNSVNYLIGKQTLYLNPDPSFTEVYTGQQRLSKGLHFWPDNSFNSIPLGNNRYRFVGSNAYRPVVTEGTLENPAEIVVSPTGTLKAFTDLGANSTKFQEILNHKPDAVSGQLGLVFDINFASNWESENLSGIVYFGGGPVYKDYDNNIILYPYYTEEGYWTLPAPAPGGAVGQIRLAVSFNNGLTFSDCGSILKSKALPRPDSQFNTNVYPYPAGIFKKDDYLYLYFASDWNTSSLSDAIPLGVARAPYSEVIASALNINVSVWNKYYNGSFSQPSLNGSGTNIINGYLNSINNVNIVSYCPKLKKFIRFVADPLIPLESNLYCFEIGAPTDILVSFSNDGINFGYPVRLNISETGFRYFGFGGENVEIGNIGDELTIFSTSGAWNVTPWEEKPLASLSLSTADEVSYNRYFTEGKYHFTVIGIDEVTNDPTMRFRCSTNDGESIYIGSDSTNSSGHVWRYKNNSWSQLTDNLGYEGFRGVHSIVEKDNTLYVGTGGKYLSYGAGKVFKNYGAGWDDAGIQFPANSNILIRNLLKVGDDIFAAGTAAYIYKLNNDDWTLFYTGSLNVFNFIDLATDGSSIFATTNGSDSLQISGIVKFDGATVTQISLPRFDVSSNILINKLHYHNNKLYAGTFNEISGCEVWQYSNNSWSKLNQNGFGSTHNMNVTDMKHIDSKLFVSVENPTGGQLWVYDATGGWSNQGIISDVKYSSYLIESFNSNNYLIGRQKMSILPDASTIVKYDANTRKSKGLNFWPDGSFSPVPIGNNQYRFMGPNAYRICVTEGTLEDPAQTVLSPTGTTKAFTDLGATATRFQLMLELKPDAVSGQMGRNFDIVVSAGWETTSGIAYFGGGVNYYDEDSDIVLNFYHTEEGYWTLPVLIPGLTLPGGWEGNIRQAVSFDRGVTYYDCGSVIKCAASSSPDGPSLQTILEAFAGVRKIGDYLYAYYWNDLSGYDSTTDGQILSIARAPYDEVIDYALNKQVSPNWKKYYNGSFDQPGEKGFASDLLTDFLVPVRKHSAVYYSSALDKTVMINTNPLTVFDTNLYSFRANSKADMHVLLSDDGFNFGYPQRLERSGYRGHNYISVIGSSVHLGELPNNFYVYGSTEIDNQGWNSVVIERLEASVIPDVDINRTYSTEKYSPNKNFTIFVKNGNAWVESIPYTKISNSWKLSLPHTRLPDSWIESSPIKQGKEEVDLYFYIGDSIAADAVGYASGLLLSNEYSALASAVPGCYTIRTIESPQTTGEFGPFTGYRFEEIRTGINTNPTLADVCGTAGTDIVLFHKLRESSTNDIYIVKYGLGGSKLVKEAGFLDWSPRNTASEDGGDLFSGFINFLVIPALSLLRQNNKNPIFKGGFITLGTNFPSYIGKQEFTKEQINLDSSGLVSGFISSFRAQGINTDIAKIVWIIPDRVRLFQQPGLGSDPFGSDYREYMNAVASSVNNLSSIFNFVYPYDPSAWASLSADYAHPSTSGHIKIAESVYNNFFSGG
jgi:hypothetical protein